MGTLDSANFVYHFGDFELDEARLELKHSGVLLPVPAKPWALLILLLKNAPRVVSHREIFQRIWHDRPVTVGVLSQVVTRLRQILADRDQELIKNIHGEGFCFVGKLNLKEAVLDESAPITAISSLTRLPGREPWQLLERLAARGESQVWLAEHQSSQERHVFKFAFDGVSKAALKREIIASRILSEECDGGFVPVLHWQLSQAPYFIETPFMDGENLEDWIAHSKTQAARPSGAWQTRALAVVTNVAKVLACAHENGIVHGDLSLKNILMQQASDGSAQRALHHCH
jgi:eukaryotic-like serine/threonine-protein kinase